MCPGAGPATAGGAESRSVLAGAHPSARCALSTAEWLLWPLAMYVLWQLLYILKTEVIDREKLDGDEEIMTSVRWLTSARKSGVHKFARRHARAAGILGPDEEFDHTRLRGRLVFMLLQLIFTVATLLPVKLCFDSFALHTVVLLVTCLNVTWNGATYYIRVFSVRYNEKFSNEKFS
jgi:hypothetical protein